MRKKVLVVALMVAIAVSFVAYAWAADEGARDITGDVNTDGIVDIFDVVTLAVGFGSEPGDENWNPAADTNHDDFVDIFDAVIISSNFGVCARAWAMIEDEKGDRIAVEPTSDEVWNKLVELYQSKDKMWIGGVVEEYDNEWGFRFKPGTIDVAEVTAEGLQTTIRGIGEDLTYWLDIGQAYVFAKVADCSTGVKIQVIAQLSSDTITRGDNVTIFAMVEDEAEKPIQEATVTATIGDLEILFLLADQGNGDYQGTIDTSIVKQGTYKIVVTAQKEGYEPSQSSLMVTVTSDVTNNPSDTDVTKFKAVVNGMRSVDVFVCVDISDGLTKKEAELIVGTTFILVMGDYVTHRLDTLTFDDTQIEAHYTWGVDENDMGHVFDVTADLTTLQITVSHCF